MKNKNKEIARHLVTGYLHGLTNCSFEEKLGELALVCNSDERLLEHINMMLDILQKAKKEIENDKGTH